MSQQPNNQGPSGGWGGGAYGGNQVSSLQNMMRGALTNPNPGQGGIGIADLVRMGPMQNYRPPSQPVGMGGMPGSSFGSGFGTQQSK